MTNTKTKCDFCKYWTGRSCMATPNSHYCKEAIDEYYASFNKQQPKVKSLRPWDQKR